MTAVELIARALSREARYDPHFPALPEGAPVEDGICCVTGESGPSIPRRALLGPSFTDGRLLAAPGSDRVGVAAYTALAWRWERMSSWICDGLCFRRLDRLGVRDAVFGDPPPIPWAGYATTSYKKHGALRAPVNGPGRAVWLFEQSLVDCSDRERLDDWWSRLIWIQSRGFGRSILETLECPSYVGVKAGVAQWMEFEAWARPRLRSALYQFLCYLLPSQKELKAKETTDEHDARPRGGGGSEVPDLEQARPTPGPDQLLSCFDR